MATTTTRAPASGVAPRLPTRGRSAPTLGANLGMLRWGLRASLLLGFLVPAALHDTYKLTVITLALVYAIALTSLVVLTGYVGQVSLCQASFMGLGTFLCAALMGHYGLSYWLAAPVTIAAVFLVGMAVGLPALRLRGLTLAIVTLSLALLADNFLFQGANWLTNNGNHWRLQRPSFLGLSLDDPVWLFDVILGGLLLALLIVVLLRLGRTGKSWFAMRDAEIAAATSGVPIVPLKLLGFGIAAALAALAGVLYALAVGSVSPEPFIFVSSIQLLALAVIAGIRSLPGAILGALFFIILPQLLLSYKELVPLTSLILGAGLILQMIFAPGGIGGAFEQIGKKLLRGSEASAEDDTFAGLPDAGAADGAAMMVSGVSRGAGEASDAKEGRHAAV